MRSSRDSRRTKSRSWINIRSLVNKDDTVGALFSEDQCCHPWRANQHRVAVVRTRGSHRHKVNTSSLSECKGKVNQKEEIILPGNHKNVSPWTHLRYKHLKVKETKTTPIKQSFEIKKHVHGNTGLQNDVLRLTDFRWQYSLTVLESTLIEMHCSTIAFPSSSVSCWILSKFVSGLGPESPVLIPWSVSISLFSHPTLLQ